MEGLAEKTLDVSEVNIKTTYKITTIQSLSPKRSLISVCIRDMAEEIRLTAIRRALADLLEHSVEWYA